MRLTLRTLLAWMDGLLPDEQQVEMASKVEGSAVAPKLVTRIRDVVARPGLTAPRVDGRGLAEDPNTVAEFLDNVLTADRLEAFERVCIESDIHLAEAADCHALLAEAARDPAVVQQLDRRLRKRLLKRLAEFVSEPPVEKPHEEAVALAAAVRDAVNREDERRRPVAASGPAQPRGQARKKASLAAWLSVVASLVLLVALGALLAWSLIGPGSRRREVAVAKPAPNLPPVVAPAADDDAIADGPEPAADAAPDPAPPAEPPPVVAPPADPAPADGPPAPAGATPADAPPAAPLRDVASAPVVALPQMQLADDEPLDADDDLQPPAPAEAAAPVAAPPPGMVAEGGTLLHRIRVGDEARWQAIAAGSPLAAIEEFVVPLHSYPRLVRGDVSIRLQPGTQAAVTTDADGTPRLEVVFGAAVAWTETAEATIGITAGGLAGVATLGPRQQVGVAVELLRAPGDDPTVVPPGRRGLVFSVGGIRWRQTDVDGGPPGQPLAGLAVDQPVPPRGGIAWTSTEPDAAMLLPATAPPVWLGRLAPATRLDRSVAAALAAALAADRPVEEALRAAADDRRVENRMAAVATLALLGDYEPLVALLCEERSGERLSDSQWLELEAATVPLALARGANAAAKLRQACATSGPARRGDELFRLAQGLGPADLAAGGAAALVDRLADDSLAIRRYAFLNLTTLVPDDPAGRLDYRPDRSASLNQRGIDWWRRAVAAPAAAEPAPSP